MRKLLAVTVLMAATAVGCGGSKDGSTETRTGGAPPVSLPGQVTNHSSADVSGKGAKAKLAMELDDFYFGPTFVKAAAGQVVTVTVKNEGKATHTFTVDGSGVDQQLAPGAKATIEVTTPANGFVNYYCRFHRGQGMQGALYSVAGAGGGASTTGSTTSTTAYRPSY
jgi:plastocyanin